MEEINKDIKRVILIEYPGIVKNLDKMYQTLGGLDSLKKVCSDSSLRLQLKFRPNDPFSHCAMADKLQLNNLLAKTIKKKVSYSDGTSEIKYETILVGLIESTYRFKTLADFQYLPFERINFNAKETLDKIVNFEKSNVLNVNINDIEMTGENNEVNDDNGNEDNANDDNVNDDNSESYSRINSDEINKKAIDNNDINENNEDLQSCSKQLLNDEASRDESSNYKSIFKQIYPHKPLDGTVNKFDENAPLFLMPIIFSRFDSPSDYYYKNDPKARKKDNDHGEKVINLRKPRVKYVYLITFQEEPPKKRIESTDHLDQAFIDQLKADFEQQPIWSKTEIAYRYKMKRNDLKLYLPVLAFYYVNGPFRGQWVKFGYNPKEDPGSRFYQTLDLRTNFLLNKKSRASTNESINLTSSPHNSTYTAFKSLTSEKRMKEVKITHNDQSIRSTSANSKRKEAVFSKKAYGEVVTDLASFKFLTNQVPKYRQIFYQLKNIELDEVKELISENQPIREVCDEKDGWWTAGTTEKIRSLMINHVDKLFDDSDEINSTIMDNIDDVEEELMEYYD